MAQADLSTENHVTIAAKRQKTETNLQKGKPAKSEVTKPGKSAKRRARRIARDNQTEEEKKRKSISAIIRKKAVKSCNWQSFIAGNKLNETSKKSILEDAKETGFQKALARRNRKAGPESVIQQTPEVTEPPMSADTIALPETPIEKKIGTVLTKQIAIDCEMVGVNDGKDNMLARVSMVNTYGDCIYDKFVFPKEEVVDYRTYVSGVRPEDLANGESFEVVVKEVGEILKGRILVGHAVYNDLRVLHLPHPKKDIRDTAKYLPFRKLCGGALAGLKKLAKIVLGIQIQQGEHNSVIDAQATMKLYMMHSKEWEESQMARWQTKKIFKPNEK